MFDLEKTIATWRHQLCHRRAFLTEDVDELERHLRDHVAALVAAGMDEAEAFRAAVAELGDAGADEAEYRKVYWAKLRRRGAVRREAAFRGAMLRSYLKVALRHLGRHRGYTAINVFGLAVGLAACLLIALHVRHELGYERVHERADRIYRVAVERHYEGGEVQAYAAASAPLAPALRAAFPEVERAVRVFNPRWTSGQSLLRAGDRAFYEDRLYYADPEVFDVFSLRLLRGEAAGALRRPASVVLSRSAAEKYFGSVDAVGRTLVLADSLHLEVTGVMADLPAGTHLKVDFLVPFSLLGMQYGAWVETLWGWDLVHTYVLLRSGTRAGALAAKLPAFFEREVPWLAEQMSYRYAAVLQPLPSIHLHSHLARELEPGSDALYPVALSLVAAFLLVIACINFVNLTTARSARRAREVGVRKVLGGRRSQLAAQFVGESVLVALAAAGLALVLAWAARPAVEALAGHPLGMGDVPPLAAVLGLAAVAAGVGVAAGGYPAFRLSGLKAVHTLKGAGGPRGGGALRRGLVVVQFVLSIALLAGTAVVYLQLDYARHRRLGFEKEHVVVLRTGPLGGGAEVLKERLLQHPGVAAVAAASGVPGGEIELMRVLPEGSDDRVPVQMLWIDHDFVRALGVEVAAGRDVSRAHPGDAAEAFLVNEAAVRAFGWDDAVGRQLVWPAAGGGRTGTVVGVVRDFHTASLHQPIEPLVLTVRDAYRYVAVRLRGGDVPGVLAFLEREWKTYAPGRPFEYAFLDDAMDGLYAAEENLARLFGVFAGLAVAVACLGLLGLAAFTVEQRTKEIGIRKVMGASAVQILAMLSKEYAVLVAVAFAAAAPLAYLAMDRWLDGFAYRVALSWPPFVLAGLAALAVALATVGYHAARAARADPVASLRYE